MLLSLHIRLAKEALEDVIIVDCDSGDCTVRGDAGVKDIVGDSNNALKQAAESLDRVKAGVNKYLSYATAGLVQSGATSIFSEGLKQAGFGSVVGGNQKNSSSKPSNDVLENTTNRDLIAAMLSQMKSALAKKPSANSLLGNFGQSAALSSKESWAAEFEKSIANSLMLFFVCLFGDIQVRRV